MMKKKKVWNAGDSRFVKEWICLQCPFPYGAPQVKKRNEGESGASVEKEPIKQESGNSLRMFVWKSHDLDEMKGIARIHPIHMEYLGLAAGDVIEIKGNEKAFARCFPSRDDQPYTDTIYLDEITLRNAGDELLQNAVIVRKTAAVNANCLHLLLNEDIPDLSNEFIHNALNGIPVIIHSLIWIRYSYRWIPLGVLYVTPPDVPVIVTVDTQIHIVIDRERVIQKGQVEFEKTKSSKEKIPITNSEDNILSVDSAHRKDFMKRIARIDAQSMHTLGILPNDIVEIQGKRRTPVRCLPLRPEQSGTQIIRVDGLVRINAGIKIGDRVRIKKIVALDAQRVDLAPVESVDSLTEEFLFDALEGVPVVVNDIVTIPYFGELRSFRVENSVPLGIIVITRNTRFNIMREIESELENQEYVNYDKIFEFDVPTKHFQLDQEQSQKIDRDTSYTETKEQHNAHEVTDWLYDCLKESQKIINMHHSDQTDFFSSVKFSLSFQEDKPQCFGYIEGTRPSYHIGIHKNLSDSTPKNQRIAVIILVHELLHAIHADWGHDKINPEERKLANLAGYYDALHNMEVFYLSGKFRFCDK